MGSDHNLGGELEGERAVSIQSQHSRIQSEDNFVVEMEPPFSLLKDKQVNVNSTIALQRNLSRKGSTRAGDSIPIVNQRVAATSSHGGNTTEKASVVAADDCTGPLLHHQITISNDTVSNTAAVESKVLAKKSSFRSQISIDPRRLFLFFATMSSLGTMLLIYFTLSSTTNKLDRTTIYSLN